MSEFTEANGATRFVPGSHKNPKPPKFGETYETVPAAGPCRQHHPVRQPALAWRVVQTARGERRWAISNYYCAGWVRQQENPFLSLAPEAVRGFPPELQDLCGISSIVASMAMWKARTHAQC